MWNLSKLFLKPKKSIEVETKTVIETKVEYRLYESLGEIKSQLACQYILNRLIKALEGQRETEARKIMRIDFNNRNASVDIGVLREVQASLGEIRSLLREYYEKEERKEE